ncbi:hypothetical protein C8Q77DRAFT_1158492 [Trametes polyzona]|nr:hypothetical protein C8Q77DRAFT_1158492 [Trametes polyzona]
MLVLTPVPAHTSYTRRVDLPTIFSDVDYFDAVAEQAAQNLAAAATRLQAIERQREEVQRQRYLQEASRRQAALDSYYREQTRLIAASAYSSSPRLPVRRPATSHVQELAYVLRQEAYVRQAREAERARALAEARTRAHAEARIRAQARQTRTEEALLAYLALKAGSSSIRQARVPATPFEHSAHSHYKDISPPSRAVSEDDLSAALEEYLTRLSSPSTASQAEDRKGKGKAAEVPPQPTPVTHPVVAAEPREDSPSLKEELEARMRNETDPEVKEALVRLYSDVLDATHPCQTQPIAGPSTPRSERQPSLDQTPSPPSDEPKETQSTQVESVDGAHLHRTPALPPAVAEKLLKFYHARRARKLSMDQIAAVEDALRKLESTFEFPAHLDFVNPVPSDVDAETSDEPGPLAYTANNTPVHAYEHALNGLLTQLDAVESNGDLAVRGRRKEVVREVERALEAVERRVEESRERERERSRERRRSAAASPVRPAIPSDVADNVTVRAKDVKADSPVDVTVASAEVGETPQANIASTADTPSSESDSAAAVSSIQESVIPESDTLSVALMDVPSSDLHPVDASFASLSTEPVLMTNVDVPEADSTTVELVDTSVPSPVAADSVAESPSFSSVSESTEVFPSEAVSPIERSEPSEATFTTAPSTLPSTTVPTPEAITREASSATDATFVTALSDSTTPSSRDAVPETTTRVPSEASSAAEETFLLSSTPLADTLEERTQEKTMDEDEPELISKEEAEAGKSDSEWSDVDAQ